MGLVLDLERLRAQTGGDRALEGEVLRLFLAKSRGDLGRIRAAMNAAARREAAHALLGSARAVGALAVARCAEALQAGEGTPQAVAALERALAAAEAAIRGRLGI
jgi:HPt (histidine-containing phosphotransfer) domain-containing protein